MIKKHPSTWLCEGDSVFVINRTYGGTFIVEGAAKVRKVLGEDRALVRFGSDSVLVERFIDKAAQENPKEYVGMLNRCDGKCSDTEALDRIQSMLDGKEWTVSMLDKIAEILRSTGREVRDVLDEDEE